MLTDREQEAWREIQRRLTDDRDFRPMLHPVERPVSGDHHRPRRSTTLVVAMTLAVLLLVGPNLLTDAELADRHRPPRPQESPASTAYAVAERAAARETSVLAGPTDIPVFGSLDVSSPQPLRRNS